jgi:hypothetical protein
MKKILLVILMAMMITGIRAQHAPVAVNDTVYACLFDSLTINLIQNDYHPDGISFRIQHNGLQGFTDSTYSIFINYETFWNRTPVDTLKVYYYLIDENGNSDITGDSWAILFIIFDNNYFDWLDLNNVRARVQPVGFQFWKSQSGIVNPPDSSIGFEFLKGSGKKTIFNSSIWIGGYDDQDSLHFAGERYRQMGVDLWPGPVSVMDGELSVTDSVVIKWNRVWKLTKEEVIYHKFHYNDENYQPVEAIATWPAQGDETMGQAKYLAPFIDTDGDGIYDPMKGDYPLIRGDQCIFFILNDVRPHSETKGAQLGIELHVMAYEFNNPDTLALHNTVFYSYKVFNRSSNIYNSTLMGLYTDFDIGNAWDDFLGCDVAKGLFYGFNSGETDGNGEPGSYGDTVPAQTTVFLGGALKDSNGEDDPSGQCDESINGIGFGDGIIDNERFGLTRFVYFYNGTVISDPRIAPEYYGYMNGLWKDGSAIEYGGNGHVSGGSFGPAARFVFPGMSDPCNWGTGGEEPYGPKDWTMETGGVDSSDVRGVGVTGPFIFKPGDVQYLDVAYVAAFAEEGKSALETALDYSGFVKERYMENPDDFGYQYLSVKDSKESNGNNRLNIWPNPVNGSFSFVYSGKNNTAVYTLRTITGKVVASGTVNNNETVVVDMTNLPEGLYIISLTAQNKIYTAKIVKQ